MKREEFKKPNKISSYFLAEKGTLSLVTVSGIVYNVGLGAFAWLHGLLAQCLYDIIKGKKSLNDMIILALIYVGVVLVVQGARYFKRFYVRRFANNTNKRMKNILYANLISKSRVELNEESIGSMMTKAVSDADACAEGMRKFTTEIFDTGIALLTYTAMIFIYDWRLALICSAFPPIAYFLANSMKKKVTKSALQYKKSASALNGATLNRVSGENTYRVFGIEENRNKEYEKYLSDYEKKAIITNVRENALAPLYGVVSMIGVLFIIYFGSKNVLGTGWSNWNIAVFTTFMSCFASLALKSSKAAKLFNSVQKASVSWDRIEPLMQNASTEVNGKIVCGENVEVCNVSFAYPYSEKIINNLNFTASKGDVIGITGKIASGKSAIGKLFLQEYPFEGEIKIDSKSVRTLEPCNYLAYMGHESELISASVEENICMGENIDAKKYLEMVCLYDEVLAMPEGLKTQIGVAGARLSGGQRSRLALARTLCRRKAITLLDDPFAAVDKATEKKILENIKKYCQDTIFIIISHRLEYFNTFNKVIFISGGIAQTSTHSELLHNNEQYKALCLSQNVGGEESEE